MAGCSGPATGRHLAQRRCRACSSTRRSPWPSIPRDPAHLLMGTDLGLLRSRNGGRSWAPEAPGVILGGGLRRGLRAGRADGRLRLAERRLPLRRGRLGARPGPRRPRPRRGPLPSARPGGSTCWAEIGLFVSEDGGQSFRRGAEALPPEAEITTLAVAPALRGRCAGGGHGRPPHGERGRRRHLAQARRRAGPCRGRHRRRRPGCARPRLGGAPPTGSTSATISGLGWRAVGRPCPSRARACAASRPTARPASARGDDPSRHVPQRGRWAELGARRRATCRSTSRPGRSSAHPATRARSTPSSPWCPIRRCGGPRSRAAISWRATDPVSLAGGLALRPPAPDRRRPSRALAEPPARWPDAHGGSDMTTDTLPMPAPAGAVRG